MNGKKAKLLRKSTLELFNATAQDTTYDPWSPPEFMMVSGRYLKVKRGVPCQLNDMCGRSQYKKLKNAYKTR